MASRRGLPQAVQAQTDKRFRRAHVTPARARRWRPDWKTGVAASLALAAVIGVLYAGASMVLSADALAIQTIAVSGNSRMSRGEVIALMDGLRGQHMLTADLEGWRARLKSSPWVADAAIRRVLPGTVAVLVLERQPIGIGRIGDDLYLIDRQGAIIDAFGPNYAELDLPIISGLAAEATDGGLLVDRARARLATRVIDAVSVRKALAARVSEIDVTDARDAVVLLKDDTVNLRVGDDQFLKRLESYMDLGSALRERVENIDYVDLRFDERVYVRPRAAGHRPQEATDRRP
jgi:cell division protein FtsQ